MDLGLDGKVALVAGGSSGIGLAIAKSLAAEGAHVAIGARDPDRLKAAQNEIVQGARGRVMATAVDVMDLAAGQAWVDRVAESLGGLQVAVVSGGSPPFGTAGQFAVADYQAAVAKVLYPAINLALHATPHLKRAGWGRLLFVASETAIASVAALTLSGVTRTALVRFAQGLAADLGLNRITVNVLAPGATRTPPMERVASRLATDGDITAQLRTMGHHNALRRLAEPEEIAAVATFLASERASFVTGGVHLIDGGANAIGPEQSYLTGERTSIDD